MGVLISPREEIEAIRFVNFDTRVRNVEKVIRVGNNLIMARLNSTTCATNRVHKDYAYTVGHAAWTDSIVEGLFKLGMISKDAMSAHIALAKESRDTRERKWAAENIRANAKTLGLKLTSAQDAKIEQATS